MSRMAATAFLRGQCFIAEHDEVEAGVDRIDHPVPIGRLVEEETGGDGKTVRNGQRHGRVGREAIAAQLAPDAAGRCR